MPGGLQDSKETSLERALPSSVPHSQRPKKQAFCVHSDWEKSIPECISLPSQLMSPTIPQWVWGSFLWLQGLQLEGFLGLKLFLGVPALTLVCQFCSHAFKPRGTWA